MGMRLWEGPFRPSVSIPAVSLALLAGVFLYRSFPKSPPPAGTNAPLAHDPDIPRRAKTGFEEMIWVWLFSVDNRGIARGLTP